jgi:iron complex outermembrane receptor protein
MIHHFMIRQAGWLGRGIILPARRRSIRGDLQLNQCSSLALVGAILAACPAQAQEQNRPDNTGEELVVTGLRYRVSEIESATRTPTPLIAIPQPVQIVTSQLIDDQRPLTISDALRNVSGFSALRNSGEVFRSFNIRGFQTLDILVDGTRQTFGLNDQPDAIANIERIEVLKGPAGALYGRGGLGATLNIVTKEPLATPRFAAGFSTGTGGLVQPTIDLTGPLTQGGAVRARLIADYEKRDTPIDYVEVERWQVAPSVAAELAPGTTITFKSDYREREGLRFVALPAYGTVRGRNDLRLPFSRFIGEPGTGPAHNTGWTSTVRLDQQLAENWSVRVTGRYMRNTLDLPFVNPTTLAADNRTLNRNYRRFHEVERETAAEAYLSGTFATGPLTHRLVLGGDWSRFTYRSEFISGRVAPINIERPVYGAPITNVLTLDDTTDLIGGWGVYLQDQIDIGDRLHLLLGLRHDSIDKDRKSNLTGTVRQRDDSAWSPRIGISYQLRPGLALFGSYGKGLVGVADGGSNRTGTPFRAGKGRQVEGGVKLDLANGLSATLAAYDLVRDGVLVTDTNPASPEFGFSIQAGQQRSRGIEFDAAWQLANRFSLIATYSYTDAQVTRDTTLPVGNRLANVPEHQGRVWGKYSLPEGRAGRFALALGGTYQGPQQANIQNTLRLPGSFVADGGLYWELGRVGAQLNIVNLFDREYITRGALGNVGVIPGDTRRVVLTLKTRL